MKSHFNTMTVYKDDRLVIQSQCNMWVHGSVQLVYVGVGCSEA